MTGLYRDDGIALVPAGGRRGQLLRQKIMNFFQNYGFKVAISPVSASVDFLDIRLYANKSHEVYHKPNSNTKYVHSKSNHPSAVLKNMFANTEKRISKLCSTEEFFNSHQEFYSGILRKSGHRSDLKYDKEPRKPKKRKRTRKVVWYNPPFCLSLKTKIGQEFFGILEKNFPEPVKDPKTGIKPPRTGLNSILNKNTIKLSFSTMNNVARIFSLHNKKIDKKPVIPNEKTCSCPRTKICPVGGKCLTKDVVYEATVTEKTGEYKNQTSTYTGLTSMTFKKRLYSHKNAIKDKTAGQTRLSAFIHELIEDEIEYEIS